jgi:DUF4097 and DUF4098 domain-containing protein YvlB
MRHMTAAAAAVFGAALVLGALAARPARAAGDPTPDLEWSWKLAPGKTVEIRGVNGEIEAVASTDGKVHVTAVKTATRSDPASVKIEVVEHERGVTVCAIYPSPDGPPNECTPGPKFSSHTKDNDVNVHFRVRMPAGIRLDARTVNGGVSATGLRGPATLETVNGAVRLETTEHGSATTVNGSIDATLGSTDGADELEFTTVNGRITVTLPPDANADVHASVMNGGIDSDFPITIHRRHGSNRASGAIGSGGPRLEMSALNGGIRLKSGPR